MATNTKSIDQTEGEMGNGTKFTALVGTGGVTAGRCVKWDGSNANTVIQATSSSDTVIGIARDTKAASAAGGVLVLSNGCRVDTSETLTVGGKVGCEASTGKVVDFASGTVVGTAIKATGEIRIQIEWQ